MEERKLTYQDVPLDYPLCFNGECTKKDCCMHYQAQLIQQEDRPYGPCVYPTAWQNGGDCKCFREKRLVEKAWGFTHLYDNVPKNLRAEARRRVQSFFSDGCGPYYRYYHGENLLSPEQQEGILKIVAQFGSTDGLRFDHYVEEWDF